MTIKRTFVLELKNDKTISLEFSPIEATGNRLWQMFATTEALDTVDVLSQPAVTETKSARKVAPEPKKTVTTTKQKVVATATKKKK
jgi:hypothetical protein